MNVLLYLVPMALALSAEGRRRARMDGYRLPAGTVAFFKALEQVAKLSVEG